MQTIHRSGARAYLTLNTLVFQSELAALDRILRQVAQSGVDALIVQDPAVALLARAICPELELHASTQMTISSAEGALFAETLGITRVVVPRELSVKEIRRLRQETRLELEVFILGALCVSWSGQCLSSEAWGGRSANRGQCAQACRMPYELVVDGVTRPLGDVEYLLSPKDLAGFRAVPELAELGIHTLKIEGRQKGPTYVRTAVESMRRWVDAVTRGLTRPDEEQLARDVRDLTLAYSRGFSDGFLAGSDHQHLVEGRFPRHRGIYLGRVTALGPDRVLVDPSPEPERAALGEVSSPLPSFGGTTSSLATAPLDLKPGMGVLFDEGKPQAEEQGGPIFRVDRTHEGLWLGFGRPGPDLARVSPGARVFVTSDPSLQRKGSRPVAGRSRLFVRAEGKLGEPLRLHCRGLTLHSDSALQRATARGLEQGVLEEKLGELGGTPYHLGQLDLSGLEPGLFLPVSQLKSLRRELCEQLDQRTRRQVASEEVWPQLQESMRLPGGQRANPRLVALCRTHEQLEAVIESGASEVILDWMELVGLGQAVRRAREQNLKVGIATVRVQKPGEEVYDKRIRALSPDLLLVRHWAGVMHAYDDNRPEELVGDFSLNVTNALTAFHLLRLGLDRLTVAHDLDEHQLEALLSEVPPERMAVVVHQHIPTFHTEHCVYSNLLSQGRDYRTCGRPCEQHQVALTDHLGKSHPVVVDVGCRNTVFNAAAQSAAWLVPRLLERGVGELRLEFVRESRRETLEVLQAYADLIAGQAQPAEVVRRVGSHEQFGVTRGTMKVLR